MTPFFPDKDKAFQRLHQIAVAALIDAALDQPRPTAKLRQALNDVLTVRKHPARDKSRDPKPQGG